jgi:hypothetical protein
MIYPARVRRRQLVGWLLLASGLAVAAVASSVAAAPRADDTLYRVRADPRMCPSPLCGGYFLARAGTGRTPCHDGALRPACYVAAVDLQALPEPVRARAADSLGDPAALAAGRLVPYRPAGTERLAALAVHQVWRAAGSSGDAGGPIYRIVDTGVRCIRAPCFSLRATAANTTRSVRLSGVDLGARGVTPSSLRRATMLLEKGVVLVSGTLRTVADPRWPDTGRVLDASQVWLPV